MPKLSDFKALLFDVDKTITDTHRVIHPETRQAFEKLKITGLIAGACTGRGYQMLVEEDVLSLFHPQSSHICCGGSLLIKSDATTLWKRGLDPTLVEKIAEATEKFDAGFVLKTELELYANQHAINVYSSINSRYDKVFKPLSSLANWDSLALVILDPSIEMREYLTHLPVTLKEMVFHHGGSLLDVTAPGVTKAEGFKKWCEFNQISPDQVIGIGDSDNDLEFLQMVGYAVGMGNSTEVIKKVVDKVIGHSDDNGLATYLEAIVQGADV